MPFKKISLILLSLSWIRINGLLASCGALSCPLAQQCAPDSAPGTLVLNYSYQYINQDETRVGTDKAQVGQIPGHHDELFTVSRIQTLEATAILHPRLSVRAALPLVQREHQHIHNHRGATLLESWNFSGLGDASLITKSVVTGGAGKKFPSVALLLGGKFPTGKTNARGTAQASNNSIQSTEAEIGLQPGSGAYDFLTGLSGEQTFAAPMATGETGEASIVLETMGRFTGKGKDDYRLGNTLTAAAGGLYPATRKLDVSMQVNARYSRPDEKGSTSEEVDKTGGVWVYAVPGIQIHLTESLGAYTHLQIPVYQNVNSIQLVSTCNLIFGLTYKFNVVR